MLMEKVHRHLVCQLLYLFTNALKKGVSWSYSNVSDFPESKLCQSLSYDENGRGIKTVWRHLNYLKIRSRRELEEVVKVLTFCCKEKRWEVCFIGKGNRFQSTGDSRKMDLGWVKTTITTGNKSSSALDRAIWRGLFQKDGKPALLRPS